MMSARDERGPLGRLTSGPLSVQLAVLSGVITALVVFVGFWILSVETRTTARRVTAEELAATARRSPSRAMFMVDTARFGMSNAGHTFGDDLFEAERMDLIEYLKTL